MLPTNLKWKQIKSMQENFKNHRPDTRYWLQAMKHFRCDEVAIGTRLLRSFGRCGFFPQQLVLLCAWPTHVTCCFLEKIFQSLKTPIKHYDFADRLGKTWEKTNKKHLWKTSQGTCWMHDPVSVWMPSVCLCIWLALRWWCFWFLAYQFPLCA